MAIKIQNQELESKIIELYNLNNSIRKIGKELSISTSYISRVLQENNLYKYSNGNISTNRDFSCKENEEWIVKHKITGKEFNDYLNKSGTLAKYLVEINPDIIIPTGFKKRQLQKQTSKYWFEEYFDIIKITKPINVDIKKCPYCEWTTIDLENKSGAFTSHLNNIHNKNIIKYIQEYPQDINLFNTFFDKLNHHLETISKTENYIECKLCNKKMKKITNSHLLHKHNITLEQYRSQFGTTTSESTLVKYKDNYNAVLKMHPNTYTSKSQIEIAEFIESLGFQIKMNNKNLLNGTELDIVILQTNICIEFNGLLYHSEKYGKKYKNYHLEKTILANNKNLILIHIFEDEWRDKKDIIKSKIAHILKKTKIKIHARKCIIKPLHLPEKEMFLNSNHILGNCLSIINYGAYYNNELVALMTFNNNRSMSKHEINLIEYELTRFAIKLNCNICGISKRFLKQFLQDYKPKKIISFAERTWTNNKDSNVYTEMGFNMVKTINPDYKYFSRKVHAPVKIHKFNFGKSSLKRKFPLVYSDHKTEWEMMQELGYDRIWDCGKWKYELDLP